MEYLITICIKLQEILPFIIIVSGISLVLLYIIYLVLDLNEYVKSKVLICLYILITSGVLYIFVPTKKELMFIYGSQDNKMLNELILENNERKY